MLGLLLRSEEAKELEYIIKRELEELLLDFEDERIEKTVKETMEEKYKMIFKLYQRIAPPGDCVRYVRSWKERHSGDE
ncbi:hypothetical protein [Salibacterium aidingense]|uniref:hypothetical protein n=1 Tax=Salibacterium aidingense TaxID=384933 RepID=UPI00047E78D4|nr:hypothetical protein [Salibacterium aidingense]